MKRIGSVVACGLILSMGTIGISRAQTPAEMAETARFLAAFQNPDGGFAAQPGGKSTLSATSSAVRTLKFCAGSIPDVPACIRYVKSCFDADSGGFAPTPGGKPDVATTASGLMAVSELKIPGDEIIPKAIEFFSKNAKSFEEIRIAIAGLEAVNKPSLDFPKWTEEINKDRNPDGTWGQGTSRAFATGGAAAALLRMGLKLEKADAVIAAMREGQHDDGGWSKGDGPSDLPSSYRIMRCFFMLKAKPDIDKLQSFIARCRKADGGYSTAPGASDTGGTYYAMIMTRWSRLLSGEPPVIETAAFTPLFNGKDLTGWEGETSLWSAKNGMIVGHSSGIKQNQFLATKQSYTDFVLKLTFRLVGGEGNSGVQFRSVRVPGTEMSGYQADIGQGYWGCLYDESRRNKILVKADEKALAALNKDGWNQYVIRCMGNQITLSLNGVTSVSYKEEDPAIARDGRIALQIHAGGPMEVQFKDLYIQALPHPTSDPSSSPGFHLRTVKSGSSERKYTVFLPTGYDGKKKFPVILFLHGAGERGEDGVRCAQVGLGSAIEQDPDAYPMIVVFPQAKQTWQAGSDDSKGALAALDDVLKTYSCDRTKIALTGLSMGGAGSWSLANAEPDRFSAVLTLCGRGRAEWSQTLKRLPIWAVVGDADRDATVVNAREMVAAIKQAGGEPKETEYRGVGHNCWDRAYSDQNMIQWMLSQSRKDQ